MIEPPDAPHRATPVELQARVAAERRGRPFLLLRDGDGAQRIIDLGGAPERMTLGRAAHSAVPLPWDSEVSRVHASLERLGDEWTLVDDGRSHNGSFIAGERVHGRRRLRDGDLIVLGQTAIVFRSPGARHESQRTATTERQATPRISAAQQRVLAALCRPCQAGGSGVPASNRQIAEELFLGIETVKTHVRALAEAFGLEALPQHQKRATLAARALDLGVVPADGERAGP